MPTYRAYLRLPPQRALEQTTTPHRDLSLEALRRIVAAHRGEAGAAVLTCDGRNEQYIDLCEAQVSEPPVPCYHPDAAIAVPIRLLDDLAGTLERMLAECRTHDLAAGDLVREARGRIDILGRKNRETPA
ncbi:MAG: hypothetical protein ABR578_10100 [Chromatocurvus sp.]